MSETRPGIGGEIQNKNFPVRFTPNVIEIQESGKGAGSRRIAYVEYKADNQSSRILSYDNHNVYAEATLEQATELLTAAIYAEPDSAMARRLETKVHERLLDEEMKIKHLRKRILTARGIDPSILDGFPLED